tara:strand:+ start:8736 stop:9098 length:363 start_codon:yes stop_codon:yes gene_type:complete
MDLLKAIIDHNEEVQSDLLCVVVPEWNNAKIYYKPSINLKAHERIEDLKNKGKVAEALASALIIRALDQDGNRLLKNSDKHTLTTQANTEVVLRVVGVMSKEDDDFDLEETKKNSEEIVV